MTRIFKPKRGLSWGQEGKSSAEKGGKGIRFLGSRRPPGDGATSGDPGQLVVPVTEGPKKPPGDSLGLYPFFTIS